MDGRSEGGRSAFADLFTGKYEQTSKCHGCPLVTKTEHPSGAVVAPLWPVVNNKPCSVSTSLEMFYPDKEILQKKCEGGHNPKKIDCDHTVAKKWLCLPKVLCVVIARFDADGEKIITGGEMDLATPTKMVFKGVAYALTAAIEHVGETKWRGHYVCRAKTKTTGGDAWQCFNDAEVQSCSASDASRNAYVAFYEQSTSAASNASLPGRPRTPSAQDAQKSGGAKHGPSADGCKPSTTLGSDEEDSEVEASAPTKCHGGTRMYHAALSFFNKNRNRPKEELLAEFKAGHGVSSDDKVALGAMERAYNENLGAQKNTKNLLLVKLKRSVSEGARKPSAFNAAMSYMKADPGAPTEEVFSFLGEIWPKEFGQAERTSAMKGVNSFLGKPRKDHKAQPAAEQPMAARGEENPGEEGRGSHYGLGNIYEFLSKGYVPQAATRKAMKRASKHYYVIGEKLYRDTDGNAKRVLLAKEEREVALKTAHSDDNAGHFGVNKTQATLRDIAKVWWPGMFEDVCKYKQTCDVCQKRSSTDLKCNQPLRTIGFPKHAMRLIGVDLKTLPRTDDGYRYLAVAVDYHSKFTFARALKTKQASEVALFLYEEIFCLCGFVRYVLTDNGKEFKNGCVSELLAKHLGVQQRFTLPYSPQTNGLVERANGIFAGILSKILKGEKKEWPSHIHNALYATRHTVHTSTGYAPSALLFGRDVVTILYVVNNGVPDVDEDELARQMEDEAENAKNAMAAEVDESNIRREFEAAKDGEKLIGVMDKPRDVQPKRPRSLEEDFVQNAEKMNKMKRIAQENQEKRSARNERDYNRRNRVGKAVFAAGDLVLEFDGQLSSNMEGRIQLRKSGPYRVVHVIGDAVTFVKDGKNRTLKGKCLTKYYPREQ